LASGGWWRAARRLGVQVIDRCNLTIPAGAGPGGSGWRSWRRRASRLVASLPCLFFKKTSRKAGRRRVCPPASRVCAAHALGLPASLTGGLELDLSTTRRGRRCPRPSRPWRPITGVACGRSTGCLTGSTPWPNADPKRFFGGASRQGGQLDDYLRTCCAQPRPANSLSVMSASDDQRGFGRSGSTTATFNQQAGACPARRPPTLRDLFAARSAVIPIQVAATASAAPPAAVQLAAVRLAA